LPYRTRSAKKWCLCEVHRSDAGSAAFYTNLPQYGPWDTEQRARQTAEQLRRLEYASQELAVREFGEGDMAEGPSSAPQIVNDFVTVAKIESLSSTERNHEHLRWQSAAQHD
jgi:hypothetical protein